MSVIDEMKRRRDQVALEADKMLRINRKQGEIGQWRKQVEQSIVQLGDTAFTLHSQGASLPPELATVCRQIDVLNGQIQQANLDVEHIRQEALPEPVPVAGIRCTVCGFGVPEVAAFCPNCGSPRPKPQPQQTCATCGEALAAGARFCPNCGQSVASSTLDVEAEAVEEEPTPTVVLCSNCQAEISPEAAFCPLCGAPTLDTRDDDP
ncbi:MAG: zinc ribbon domain-containing protein [Anaerolineae bacterium]|nr:zinc ribbon domain-containing protein [Anaerolineae bacterium]